MKKRYVSQNSRKIRIISGLWRGRKFSTPDMPGLRPTKDRIRETLFNWLAPVIKGTRCLDCFAGSGSLGFEALSRHAAHATLLEYNHIIAAQLKKNVALINTDKVTVQHTDALKWLLCPGIPYHVAFLDPPFRKGLLPETVMLLENNGWLTEHAYIYVESETENSPKNIPLHWNVYRKKVSGQVSYSLYKRGALIQGK
ncbi:16S rRNA (guanine(966)-N(2))-methyltransferase RsmD [Candidatus Profftia tarda]|uniref:Ribosomal RNA small subunit methyltransferase D n=1 Tax=Candidatus Profftia tarda TaxID=1177216 RepID=A0A8E4GHY3_9ENTR|nr:16S rRNA (guanine(966)-N(2))-methyltransferase RsmD [Candidatus Profftia tarda]CAD6512652.1 Ribosomal RNA small subunit methyltransferase D [Candidatus Profftia tarda]